ncbi:hypothetical protein Ddye_008057 [Dipteronia dyeriana]|uniref:HAT C-terminal dimerisation domain-containing protein n=1 Tax=Dipteronia dyeriana TaxID=168575 RepID=A0AAD9X8S7_9ROSI|nr:hypothetical protein Ddye_008057 [Dipteronia dyeriana]
MDFEEVTKLFASLSLTDKDGPDSPVVKLDTHMEEIEEPKVALSLVGKIFANERIDRYVFKRIIPKIWRTTQEFEVEWIRENLFAFHFTNQMDRKGVIARGPWSFDNFLLALEEPKGLSDSDIAKMQFNCVEFSIQIHKGPLICMNKEMVIFLGKQIGVLKATDLGESGDCWAEVSKDAFEEAGLLIEETDGEPRDPIHSSAYRPRTKGIICYKKKTKKLRGSSSSSSNTYFELESYLGASFEFIEYAEDKKFDILHWWNEHEKYIPILAMIAKQIFSTPVSTVAVEQQFSAGGNILDSRRSLLSPKSIQIQACVDDWTKAEYRQQEIDHEEPYYFFKDDQLDARSGTDDQNNV